MLRYKIDVLRELKLAGYNPQRLREEGLISQSSMTAIRQGKIVRPETLDTLCCLLGCQPGMILEYVPPTIDERKSI